MGGGGLLGLALGGLGRVRRQGHLGPELPVPPLDERAPGIPDQHAQVRMTMMGRAIATKRRLRPRYFQIFFIALVMMYKSGPFR